MFTRKPAKTFRCDKKNKINSDKKLEVISNPKTKETKILNHKLNSQNVRYFKHENLIF